MHFSHAICASIADVHVQMINVHAVRAIDHIIKLLIREWDLCSMTVSVQVNVHETMNYVFFTVRRRNGVMASGVCPSAQPDTPCWGWRRGLRTPRTGGTHPELTKCTVTIICILMELNWTSNKKLLGSVNEFKCPEYWRANKKRRWVCGRLPCRCPSPPVAPCGQSCCVLRVFNWPLELVSSELKPGEQRRPQDRGPEAHGNLHWGHKAVTAVIPGLKTGTVESISPSGFVC